MPISSKSSCIVWNDGYADHTTGKMQNKILVEKGGAEVSKTLFYSTKFIFWLSIALSKDQKCSGGPLYEQPESFVRITWQGGSNCPNNICH